MAAGHFVQMISDRGGTLVFSGIRDVVRALFVADDATAAKVVICSRLPPAAAILAWRGGG